MDVNVSANAKQRAGGTRLVADRKITTDTEI